MTDLRQRLLDAFSIEHRDHLEVIRNMLAGYDGNGTGGDSVDMDELHRRLHSLKGAARATDLTPIETLSHRLESMVSGLQKTNGSLDARQATFIRTGLDAVEDWFAAFVAGDSLPDMDAVIDAADRVTGLPTADPAKGNGADQEPAPPDVSDTGITEISAEPNDKGETSAESGVRTTASDSVRVDVASLDRLLRSAGDILLASSQAQRFDADMAMVATSLETLKREAEGFQAQFIDASEDGGSGTGDGLRAIHDIVSRARSLSSQLRDVGARQKDYAWRSRQLSRQLRDEVQAVRMVPAETVFGGFRKMVRDLARHQNKQVMFEITGAETRADRKVLQELKDPLLHILRNAVGHGIETPAERTASGKAEQGNIRLSIHARSGKLEVLVADDGRGLDLGAIEQTARKAGLLRDQDEAVSDFAATQRLLTRSGFSTRETVDEIAGRGVGMSVVQTAVARLQGHLRLAAGKPVGLEVSISVPLSVATMPVVVVDCGDSRYALPSNAIERLYRVDPETLDDIDNRPVFVPDGTDEAIAVAPLNALLEAHDAAACDEDTVTLAILKNGETRIAVVVESVVTVMDAVVDPPGLALPESDLVAGTIVAEDGAVIPLLNPATLAERSRNAGLAGVRRQEALPAVAADPLILVVDDSITTRTLEKSILEANGYRVRLSVDGLDALEQLRLEPVDLVVSDVEMPRMNGFDLVSEIKSDRNLNETPVVLVTSLDSEDDRRRGLSVGADAYVVKQRFDQTNLLETIGQLI